jgi:hypothetical protein
MPAVAGVWGPNVWGPNVWGAHVWGDGTVVAEVAALHGSASSEAVLAATISGHPMSNKLTVGSTNTVSLKGLKNMETRPLRISMTPPSSSPASSTRTTWPSQAPRTFPMPYISGVGHSVLYRGTIPILRR